VKQNSGWQSILTFQIRVSAENKHSKYYVISTKIGKCWENFDEFVENDCVSDTKRPIRKWKWVGGKINIFVD